MQNAANLTKHSSLRITPPHTLRRMALCSQITTGQQTSPIVFPEKRSRGKASACPDISINHDESKPTKGDEHKIDIGDEQSDLLGYDVFSGKLVLDKRKVSKKIDVQTETESAGQDAIEVKLTSKALIWGNQLIRLEDVISVSYYSGLRYFTVHSYPYKKVSGLSCFVKTGRSRKDFRFIAATSEEALHWVGAFADQQCYVNCLPHPLKQASEMVSHEFSTEFYIKCKSPPKMLVILNPRSGRGRSSKVFHGVVEPVFKLAGFQLEVVKTNSAGHARKLAASVDFSTCPDGIICVGGDGIVNEVLNGLLSRDNQKEAISIPIGIIPAGSDNSLVWTVLGVRDPLSAAIAIVKIQGLIGWFYLESCSNLFLPSCILTYSFFLRKHFRISEGGLTATDVFAVEWIQSGVIHFGTTVTYFGFVSDVLELSERYQKRFGPLRYFVAGFLKFFCLPKYNFEVEYLPASVEVHKSLADQDVIDMADLYTDIMRRSSKEGLPRASSLSSIDSIMSPSRMSGVDMDTTCSNTEPSEYVRAIDSKSKRLSAGRSNMTAEPEVIHPQLPLTSTPVWPRTRSKSRNDKGWTGLSASNDVTRSSWANTTTNDKEDISSTLSDPGPIWDAEPRWDSEPGWDQENPIELTGQADDTEVSLKKPTAPVAEEKWMVKKGHFLGILVCNHSCKTVQSLSSQVVAPKAEHDDNTLDLLLVHGRGRLRLIRFFLQLQMGRHLSLPYVEYIKVKSVKVKPGKHSHKGCGIDGELFTVNGQVVCALLPDQCRLIGRSPCSK
ncbi:OLC1v1001148C4 [Oldenlandia corymbosa var. corymbosa]|uniref:OLC1v1001148C4 n=1 Tax=Oldenlandia corymbosa var. corymbosa TaxID=529605 RepID=A0AAV1D771_OLDCO|nr:OLC1v1001148C4 [Oldenlandia corymbosa var. corymbosa]